MSSVNLLQAGMNRIHSGGGVRNGVHPCGRGHTARPWVSCQAEMTPS